MPLVPLASARRARNEPEPGANLRALIPLVPLASARRARNEPEPGAISHPLMVASSVPARAGLPLGP